MINQERRKSIKPFNWIFTWAVLLAVFTIFLSVPQSNSIEETIGLVDFVSSDGFDAPEASVENTGSDIWSDAILYSYQPAVYLYGNITLKRPQINWLSFCTWLLTSNSYYNICWDRRTHANKNNYIA